MTATGRHHVRWCFHTTAMVNDYERTRDRLARLVGLRVLEDSRIEDPAIGRRGGMTWIGDNMLEIGEPIVTDGAVDRFVRRFGSHMSSIAAQVEDIDATIAFLESHDVHVAAHIDGHIVFTAARDTMGVVIEWFDDEVEEDPRFGGALPPYPVEPLLDVTHMAFGGAIVADPGAAAHRFAELFEHPITFIDPDAPPGSPQAGVSMGDLTFALYPLPEPEESRHLWGWVYERPQTCNLGVCVPDLALAHRRLLDEQVTITRADERSIVIDPSDTGGVVVVVVDELLPGDPRRAPSR